MDYATLGHSSLNISAIGFGCMSLGEEDTVNAQLIHQAIEAGINYFDTADIYQQGYNETTVGKAIAGKRNQVILATKVGNQPRPDGKGWDWNPRKAYILEAVEESLTRLQTDYIDLYQLHGGTIEDPIEETIEAFELLQQQGKIRYYGISSIRPNVIREYVRRGDISQKGITSVMMQYSLLDRRPEETCLPLLQQHQVGVVARGSVAKGLLVNKPAAAYLNYSEAEVAKAAAAIQAVSNDQRGPAQTALRFVLQQPGITSAIVGMRTQQQLQDAIKATTAPALSQEELTILKQSLLINHYDQHR
jgi:aryl-alcohol dehydrogenase-like predicted oxidoreductase